MSNSNGWNNGNNAYSNQGQVGAQKQSSANRKNNPRGRNFNNRGNNQFKSNYQQTTKKRESIRVEPEIDETEVDETADDIAADSVRILKEIALEIERIKNCV